VSLSKRSEALVVYKVFPGAYFSRQAKKLAKRYPSFPSDLEQLADLLESNPTAGIALGMQAYKLRMAIRSKGRGKSGGARVIYYLITAQKEVWLLSVYDKADLDNLGMHEIQQLIDDIGLGAGRNI
jgi:mRNA-degrading endonuclease RelE of RelBE toxin-antitoxin system